MAGILRLGWLNLIHNSMVVETTIFLRVDHQIYGFNHGKYKDSTMKKYERAGLKEEANGLCNQYQRIIKTGGVQPWTKMI